MSNLAVKAVLVLALPLVVLLGGGWIMEKWSQRDLVKKALEGSSHSKPLNLRWLGYGIDDVENHWKPLLGDPKVVGAEQKFLQLDLAFPLLYGAALAISLWMAWAALGRPFHAWLIAPVAVGMLADWTENLVQLQQLDRFRNRAALEATWIHVASAATVLKLLSLSGAYLFLAWLVYRAFKADSLPAS
ncbi:MAG TPA: hypothetical protein VE685_03435 [Thermoanaerobaculia bacterium]|nr:hypothetical protein [Thermoanaerobaculia bacterium]